MPRVKLLKCFVCGREGTRDFKLYPPQDLPSGRTKAWASCKSLRACWARQKRAGIYCGTNDPEISKGILSADADYRRKMKLKPTKIRRLGD